MRATQILWNTLKEAPAGIDLPGQNDLIRAGMLRSPSQGAWTYLPLGWKVMENLTASLSTIAGGLGAERVSFPPTGLQSVGPLKPAWNLAAHEFRSYKHLPRLLTDVYSRPCASPASRLGLLGASLTRRMGFFGFTAERQGAMELSATARKLFEVLLESIGLQILLVSAGSQDDHHGIWEHPAGSDRFYRCMSCGKASMPWATLVAPPEKEDTPMGSPQEVETPGCTTIAVLAEFLEVPESRTMKVVFYTADDERVICAVIRGDLAIDEGKLSQVLAGQSFRPSSDYEVRAVGSVPGYGSPIGLRRALVLVDPSVTSARNLVAGANREPFHMLNINAGRDFRVDKVVDLREVREGDTCGDCAGKLALVRGFTLISSQTLETHVAGFEEASYLDEAGKKRPIVLTYIELDLDRIIGATAEAHRDEDGLRWPATLTPAHVHLLGLKIGSDPATAAAAELVFERLNGAGLTVLYDDRDERPGVAFKDADLLGLPLRLTVSQRSLEAGGIEVKWRDQAERSIVAEEDLEELLRRLT